MKLHRRFARRWTSALRVEFFFLTLTASMSALGQTCSFNPNQPGSASFGAIDPTLLTPATFSVTVNYKCTGSAAATFTIMGLNDSGPGAYRLKHVTQNQFMPYSISTVNVPGTKITFNGQIVATDYQNAYVGNYSDTLTITIFP
ncbi:MAG TPA: spore coat protein U domain-containing protein [Casimicrobiaceae bacterium]|nr:spore coat protein U domain-containing protein [Casimicrobiaceae bacterium]